MRTFDYSRSIAPPWVSTGFSIYSTPCRPGRCQRLPPYNIEKAGDNAYRIVMAVAGFAEAEPNVTQKENELLVTGQTAPANGQEEKQFLYRGIAGRNFERRQLAEPCEGHRRQARQRPAHHRAAA